jgi:hypothetical protein
VELFQRAVISRTLTATRVSRRYAVIEGRRPFLTGQAFDPKAIREMSLALESVCNALGVRSGDEVTTRLVAEKIIELAGHGMRGATLHATAVKEVEAHRGKM